MTDTRRSLPPVHALLDDPHFEPLLTRAPRAAVVTAIRAVLDAVRQGRAGAPGASTEWAALVRDELARAQQPSLRRTINATGVVLHTNLGRAPLAAVALDAIAEAARGYSTLEYDVAKGGRGSRAVHTRALLCELTGAEDALVVNNCAAGLVLALRALAGGRDALISRGELIEIGGSFRVSAIMAESGAHLVEIGTTNRTHLDDYRRALTPGTGAIVKVHRSNFTMSGFVADVALRDLTPVASEADIALVYDFGSGLMLDLSPWGLTGEPTAASAVADGATVVVMSGDKLLGGPQAGIVVGRASAIAALRSHPLARALRVDKLTLAALEATLALYRDPATAVREVPTLAMITEPQASVRSRAAAAADALAQGGLVARVVNSEATVGGGAFPDARLPSAAIALEGAPARWEQALRAGRVPVIGRIQDGELLLDFRTVSPADETDLLGAVREAAA